MVLHPRGPMSVPRVLCGLQSGLSLLSEANPPLTRTWERHWQGTSRAGPSRPHIPYLGQKLALFRVSDQHCECGSSSSRLPLDLLYFTGAACPSSRPLPAPGVGWGVGIYLETRSAASCFLSGPAARAALTSEPERVAQATRWQDPGQGQVGRPDSSLGQSRRQ